LRKKAAFFPLTFNLFQLNQLNQLIQPNQLNQPIEDFLQ